MNPQTRETGGIWAAYGRGEKDFEVTDPDGRIKVPDYPEVPEKVRGLCQLSL